MALVQLVWLLLMVLTSTQAQGDELRGFRPHYLTARQTPDRYYPPWMSPGFMQPRQPLGVFPTYQEYPHFQPYGREMQQPAFFPNYQNPHPHPPPPQLPQPIPNPQLLDEGKDPVIILLPPTEQQPTPTSTPPAPAEEQTTEVTNSVSIPAIDNENDDKKVADGEEEKNATEVNNAAASLAFEEDKETQRSGGHLKSATSGFTNAHHYPFPIGLWTQYISSTGFDKNDEDTEVEKSPVNPRRFPSLLFVPPNHIAVAFPQQSQTKWNYNPQTPALSFRSNSFPSTLVHVPDDDLSQTQLTNGARNAYNDAGYNFFAVPLRSVLSQMNAEVENDRV